MLSHLFAYIYFKIIMKYKHVYKNHKLLALRDPSQRYYSTAAEDTRGVYHLHQHTETGSRSDGGKDNFVNTVPKSARESSLPPHRASGPEREGVGLARQAAQLVCFWWFSLTSFQRQRSRKVRKKWSISIRTDRQRTAVFLLISYHGTPAPCLVR